MDDAQILELFFQRDESAIARTDAKYGAALRALSHNIVGSVEDAEECVSDTYFKAWEQIPPQRPNRYFAWLSAVTRNFSVDLYRRHRALKRDARIVELSAELEQCVGISQVTVDDIVLREVISHYVRMLDRESQYIFMRRYYYADTLAQIAQATGRSENNLASLLFRLRKRFKKHLEKEGIFL